MWEPNFRFRIKGLILTKWKLKSLGKHNSKSLLSQKTSPVRIFTRYVTGTEAHNFKTRLSVTQLQKKKRKKQSRQQEDSWRVVRFRQQNAALFVWYVYQANNVSFCCWKRTTFPYVVRNEQRFKNLHGVVGNKERFSDKKFLNVIAYLQSEILIF